MPRKRKQLCPCARGALGSITVSGPADEVTAIIAPPVFGEWSGTATPVEQLPAARERPAIGFKND
jgi:hypothetical protein